MAIKKIIEDTKEALANDPAATRAAFTTDSDLVGLVQVDVTIGDHTVPVDEPSGLGGGGTAPNPVEYALASLGSCQAITYRVWADKLGIRLDRVRVRVDGDLDLQGFFGFDGSVRPGFHGVEVEVELEGPEDPAVYEELAEAVNDHCPVLDIFRNPVPVDSRVAVTTTVEPATEA